jgi:hypothetical protein
MKMNKEEVLKLMLDSINQDNIDMCERASMDRDKIDKSIEESQPTLKFMVGNLYDRMKAADILKS